MSLLRSNELYASLQGEGPRTGVQTVFCRFSGCNLRCPGWPCDTPHAIFPDQWRTDPMYEAEQLYGQIRFVADQVGATNICITGGEPFMQPSVALNELAQQLLMTRLTIDVFTNGTFLFPDWVQDYNVAVIMDWKLQGSGDAQRGQEQRLANVKKLGRKDGIKFVVKDYDDLDEALAISRHIPFIGTFWVGRVWGAELTDADIVRFMQDNRLQWRLNIQTHKLIWPNVERGI